MKKIISLILLLSFIVTMTGCSKNLQGNNENMLEKSFDEILTDSKGTTVNFYGWGGSQQINDWLDTFVSANLKEKYDINFNRVPMNIDDVLNKLLGEKQLNTEGTIDIVWINGENFYTAKKNDLLYGPFIEKLPNFNKNIDKDSLEVKYDFGFPVEGHEAPYGKAQFVMIYDEERVNNIPTNHESLLEFVKNNPGKFTYPAPPDFTGSAFVRNIIYDIVGYEKFLKLDADKETVYKEIEPAINYLKKIKPYLWKKGETYPATIAQLDNMFADNEVVMSMSYNPNSASGKVSNGQFPQSTRTFLFENGTIGNTHFLAIPKNSTNKEGALTVINYILSVEAQVSKYNPENWGDLPVIDNNKLNDEEKKLFDNIKLGEASIPQSILLDKRVPEMPADLIPIIEQIWLENIPVEGE